MTKADDSIPDMTDFRYNHVPELAFRPDLSTPIAATAIGWLGHTVPETGLVSDSLIAALRAASTKFATDRVALGYHLCQICKKFEDRGEFIIETGNRTYVLPKMILHYIEDHHYKPPNQFVNDLTRWNVESKESSSSCS